MTATSRNLTASLIRWHSSHPNPPNASSPTEPVSQIPSQTTVRSPRNANEEAGILSQLLSTIQHFNNGISRLKSDVRTSHLIREAEATRIQLHRKILREREQREGRNADDIYDVECTSFAERRKKWLEKHLPRKTIRRSNRHLHQTQRDLRTTLPTVLGFIVLPGVGYGFLFMGIMFPRFLLSRQFHTREQRKEFAMEEYKERRRWFERLAGDFWGSFMRACPQLVFCEHAKKRDEVLSLISVDAAGPVLDEPSMIHIYDLCYKLIYRDEASPHSRVNTSAFSTLPISHLHSISLACNLSSIFPLPAVASSALLQFCVPRPFLESRLTHLVEDIIADDATLLEEGHCEAGCDGMTDEEVLDACLSRGLPVARFARDTSGEAMGEIQCMRTLLTNHLKMMSGVMKYRGECSVREQQLFPAKDGVCSKSSLVRDVALHVLVLHLPAIRYQLLETNTEVTKKCQEMN
ncbi:hypothetical protein HJC23_009209 [Cyclotella cryptica]|uniref:Letm1 RBD domain-containing protein n=1 Tax=Cyclotella cryptica TaxID=29204 RepID=A0ABD3P0Q3_9STRA